MPVLHQDATRSRIGHRLRNAVETTIASHNMVQSGDSVLVGVSGGPDSVALLHLLSGLSSKLSIRLGVAHLNHSLRQSDSDRDARFVAALSQDLDVPCYVSKRDIRAYQQEHKLGLEAAARQVRYAFFHSTAEANGYTKIATGHHRDDNAEVVLMDLLRGSGTRGISGIPPVRDGRIIRPLIELSRAEIMEYLTHKELAYRSDASNWDEKYLRNRIRHRLIPSLTAAYNPRIVDTLNRLAKIVRSEDAWIEETIRPIFETALLPTGQDNQLALSIPAIHGQHLVVQRRMIRKSFARVKGDLKRITLAHVEAVIQLLNKGVAGHCLDFPDRVRVCLDADRLVFSKEERPLRSTPSHRNRRRGNRFSYLISGPGTVSLPEIAGHLVFSVTPHRQLPKRFHAGQPVGFLDMDRVDFPLTVRNVRSGDRFTPLGMGGSQKVNTYFINRKVPRSQRERYPLVVDRKGTIVWVAGHQIGEPFKITASTRTALRGELFLA